MLLLLTMICEKLLPPMAMGADTIKRGISCPTNSVTFSTRLSLASTFATLSVIAAVRSMLLPLGLYISTTNWSRSAAGTICWGTDLNTKTPATTTATHTTIVIQGCLKQCSIALS